jgi:amino acid transporter
MVDKARTRDSHSNNHENAISKLPPNGSKAAQGLHELLSGEKHSERLSEWPATAICGNDITSSCLYVAGIATVYAHALAPLALILVAVVLYLYRKIYTEVVEALPLNGGAYNCLLNCTRKYTASIAACFTLLSYLATAVISAKTGSEYLNSLLPFIPPMETTAIVLVLFAGLTILGIVESSKVALAIFTVNLASLALFVVWAVFALTNSPNLFLSNWEYSAVDTDWPRRLFLGFSASLLGVSGFESSANFVEQQRPGVFRLTLRNMWIAVTIINPIIVLLALSLVPIPDIVAQADSLLAFLGHRVGGNFLHGVIVVNAFLVLSGAVLTSYIGVTGLVHRMTQDQCFPEFLLKPSRRGTYHRIILIFMISCVSILYLTQGHLLSLAGVYTIAFLSVMTLFGIGNILLKVNRKELKRTFRAGWFTVALGTIATGLGIIGNLVIDYRFAGYFAVYFVPAVLIVSLMIARIGILKGALRLVNELFEQLFLWRTRIIDTITSITHIRVVLFIRGGRLQRVAKAFEYIYRNESSKTVLVLHLFDTLNTSVEEEITGALKVVKELYPEFRIEYLPRIGRFNPETVEQLSRELSVPKNMMFIGAPEAKHSFSVQDLGGVRVIF